MAKEIFAVIWGIIGVAQIIVWKSVDDYQIFRLVISIVMTITAIPMEIYQVYYSPFSWYDGDVFGSIIIIIIQVLIGLVNLILGIVGIVLTSKYIKSDREIARAKENEELSIKIEELRGKLPEIEQEIAGLKEKQSTIMDQFNNFEGKK